MPIIHKKPRSSIPSSMCLLAQLYPPCSRTGKTYAMAAPTITLWNGIIIHCDSQPQVYPCVADGFACWNSSSSNCFGLIYDLNDPAGSGVIPSDFVCSSPTKEILI